MIGTGTVGIPAAFREVMVADEGGRTDFQSYTVTVRPAGSGDPYDSLPFGVPGGNTQVVDKDKGDLAMVLPAKTAVVLELVK